MPDTKTYKTTKGVFEIPKDKMDSFLKSFPDAKEVESFTVGKDTFDIPLEKVEGFKGSMPKAKPLKKKDGSEISSKDSPEAVQTSTSELSDFNPSSDGYDYETAKKYGLSPDESGHWPSRVPETGLILKGSKHPTFDKTIKGEEGAGYSVEVGKDGRYYSQKTNQLIKDSEGYTPPEISLQEQAQAEQPSLETPELPTSKLEQDIVSPEEETPSGFRTVGSPESFKKGTGYENIKENIFSDSVELSGDEQAAKTDVLSVINETMPVMEIEDNTPLTPDALSYITGQGYNQSMIGLADAIYNKKYRVDPEWLEKYDPNLLEKTFATAFGFLLDTPTLAAGSIIGKTAAKPVVNKVVNTGVKKLTDLGVKKEIAEQIVRNGAKRTISAINAASSSAGALGLYDLSSDALGQWADPENDFEDIKWSQSLASGGKGVLLGAGVGLIGEAFTPLKNVAKGMKSNIPKNLALAGLTPVEIAAENALFTYGGALLEGRELKSVTKQEFLEGALLLGVLKGQGAAQRANFKKSPKFNNDKPGKGIFETDLYESELKDLGYTDYKTAITDLAKSDSRLVDVYKDKNVSALTKAKVLWSARGVKMENSFHADYAYAEGNTLSIFNKEGVLLDKTEFRNNNLAEDAALTFQAKLEDSKNQMKGASLTNKDKVAVVNNVGEDIKVVNEALAKSPSERTPEERKAVNKYNAEVDKKIQEAQKDGTASEIPELKLSDDVSYTLNKIEKGEPVINQRLVEASNELYSEYVRLGKEKKSTEREQTTEQIETAREFLYEEINNLDKRLKTQAETKEFVKDITKEKVEAVKEEAKKEVISKEESKVEQTPTKEEKVAETPPKEPKTDIKEPKVEPKIKEDEKVLQGKAKKSESVSKEVAKEKDSDGKKEVLEDTQSGIKEAKKADIIPEEGQKELPDNVIKSKDGLFELNEGQVEQRNEMRKKYGKERADELILDFIDSNDLKKYSVDPFVKKVKQIKEDAKKTDKVPTEGKKPTTEKVEESKPKSGVREGDKTKATQKETVEKTERKPKEKQSDPIAEAESLEELQHLLSIKKVKFGPEFNKRREQLVKEDKLDDTTGRVPIIKRDEKGSTKMRMGGKDLPVTPSGTRTGELKTFKQMLGDWAKKEKKKIKRGSALYDPSTGRIQGRQLREVVHEIGHFLDDKHRIVEKIPSSELDAITKELSEFSKTGSKPDKLLTDAEKIRYIQAEGIAEYFTAMTLNPTEAMRLAPEFSKHVAKVVDAKSMKNFMDLSNDVRDFVSSSASEQIMANVGMETESRSLGDRLSGIFGKKGSKEFQKTQFDKFIEAWGNKDEVSLKAFNKLLKEQGVDPNTILGEKDFVKTSRLLYGMDNKLYDFLKHGVRDVEGNIIKDGNKVINDKYLYDAISEISKNEKEFNNNLRTSISFATAKRVVEIKGNLEKRQIMEDLVSIQKKDKSGRSIDNSKIPSEEVMKKHPEIIGEELGDTTVGEYVDKLRSKGLKDYKDDRYDKSKGDISGSGGGIFNDYDQATEALRDFENMKTTDKKTYDAISETHRRYEKMADEALKYYRDSGRISEKEYNDIKKNNNHYISFARNRTGDLTDASFSDYYKIKGGNVGVVDDVVKKLTGGVSEINNPYVSLYSNIGRMIKEADRNSAMRSFTDQIDNLSRSIGTEGLSEVGIGTEVKSKAEAQNDGKYVIDVYDKGKKKLYDINPDVHSSLTGVGLSGAELSVWLKPLGLPVKTLERSVTSFPVFAARNKIRDIQQAFVFTKGKFSLRGIAKPKKGSISDLNAAGGGQFGYMMNPKRFSNMQSEIGKKIGKKDILVDPRKLAKGVDQYMKALEWVEASTRAGEFDRVYQDMTKKGLSHKDASIEAAFAARDLMDFSVKGSQIKFAKLAIPFVNPRIQGIRKLYRHTKANPLKTAVNFTKFVIAPIMVEKMVLSLSDDDTKDRYKELPNFRKDFFYNVPIGDGFLTIPKPFEVAVVGNVFMRGFDKILLDDDRPYDNNYQKWLATSLSPVDPGIVMGETNNPLSQALRNYDSFRQRNIISGYEDALALEMRQTFTASRAGQAVQKAIGVDARKADHLIKGLFSYWGEWAVAASDIGKAGSRNKISIKNTGFYKPNTPFTNENVIWVNDHVSKYGLSQDKDYKDFKNIVGEYYSTDDKEYKKILKSMIDIEAEFLRGMYEATLEGEITIKKMELEFKKMEHEIK